MLLLKKIWFNSSLSNDFNILRKKFIKNVKYNTTKL